MECGRRHGGRWLDMVWGIYFFGEDGKKKFWDVWNLCSEYFYILFGKVLHIYIRVYKSDMYIYKYMKEKKRKSTDPNAWKVWFFAVSIIVWEENYFSFVMYDFLYKFLYEVIWKKIFFFFLNKINVEVKVSTLYFSSEREKKIENFIYVEVQSVILWKY